MKPLDLAKVLADLADDPSWPWDIHNGTVRRSNGSTNLADVLNPNFIDFIAQSPLTMARLALMVVEEKKMRLHSGAWLDWITKGKIGPSPSMMITVDDALTKLEINPNDFASVKKRVDEAET